MNVRLETMLAALLRYGTWLAAGMTGVGLALPGTGAVTVGIALFILLPVVRVALMLGFFVRERDCRFIAITGLVLAIILMGFALGRHMANAKLRSGLQEPISPLSAACMRGSERSFRTVH